MRLVKKQGKDVRTKLLEIACKVFAEKGYRNATVAEICEAAGTNIAAINYYFGDKETLYLEAWHLAFNRSIEVYPPDGGVPADAPIEERFRGRILAALRRFANPENYEFEIMSKELATPTGLLEKVIQESIEPIRYDLFCIIRKLLGKKATEQQAMLCQMLIMGQCLNLTIQERHRKAFVRTGMKTPLLRDDCTVEELADYVFHFSLAGIREIKRLNEAGESSERHSVSTAHEFHKKMRY
jgi:TetR/AcrR family transcriptional regulator, regulator of cefoperazone and chloramphenicol sensitivity